MKRDNDKERTMNRLEEFYSITDAEEYFEFFDIEYNERLVQVKRFHIMRKFGEMVAKARELEERDEVKLLGFFKFALLTVYKNFETGYNPTAADVWRMYDNPIGCISVTLDEMGEVANVQSSCSTCGTSSSCSNNMTPSFAETPAFMH
jgi:nitrogenase-stabilizing/protective protein